MRPTALTLDLAALRHNARVTKDSVGAGALCAVVKANAYGHGAEAVARALVNDGVEMLAVALVEEAETLRHAGLTCPILILGGDYRGAHDALVRLQLLPAMGALHEVEALQAAAAAAGVTQPVHLEVDTGMARLGAEPADIAELAQAVARAPNLELVGLMTHLSHADVPEHPWTARQVDALESALAAARAHCPDLQLRHVISSGALVTAPSAPHDIVRCGLSLYGVQPVAARAALPLRPVARWTTRPVALRRLDAGQSVSYGARWTAARPSHIATLPVGYADGYFRAFGNKAQVLIRGQRVPIVGTVCMDLCMADVTDVPGVTLQDEVVLLGRQAGEELTAHDLAAWAQTIPYEILARIGPRVPRVYVDGHGGDRKISPSGEEAARGGS